VPSVGSMTQSMRAGPPDMSAPVRAMVALSGLNQTISAPLVVFLACDQVRAVGGTLLSATAGDRAHIMVNRRWRGAILTASGYGGLAGSSNAVGTPALKTSDDKAAILEAMVILPSAIAMPAGHNADCVITTTVRRTPVIVRAAGALKRQTSTVIRDAVWPVTQPVRDSDGATRRGLVGTAAPISHGPSRRTATAT
jgi:hypothetical protein